MKYGSLIALLLVVMMVMVPALPWLQRAAACCYRRAAGSGSPLLPQEPAAPTMDIVDTAVAAGSFNTLVTAVQAAGLEEALRGEGPFTVFAPTDDAFAAMPADTAGGPAGRS